MSPSTMHAAVTRPSAPRVSGDEPNAQETVGEVLKCSPRERG